MVPAPSGIQVVVDVPSVAANISVNSLIFRQLIIIMILYLVL